MNDPERLLTGSPRGLGATLLRAGVAEKPSGRSLERTLAALSAAATTLGTAGAAGALGASTATTSVASLTLLGLAKWAGVGIASGVAMAFVSHAAQNKAEPAPATVSVPAREAPVVAREAPRPTLAAPEPTTTATSDTPVHGPASAGTGAGVSQSVNDAPLAAEVAFVDRGRGAFQRADADAALTALDSYEHAFPDRRLLPEVLYLRMEARSALGDRTRAVALARLLLRDFSKTPHAARARALLGEAE